MNEPLAPPDAKRLILAILENGTVTFSKHADEEMVKDNLGDADALNVLRGGVVEIAELEKRRGAIACARRGCTSWWRFVRRRSFAL